MAPISKPVGDLILKQAMDGQEDVIQNPTVLSCGGIYIPRREDRDAFFSQFITTSRDDEPVRLVTSPRPKNVLYEILLKESLN